jgi:hypothetical protein
MIASNPDPMSLTVDDLEVKTEPTSGFALNHPGELLVGFRVSYRLRGSRRWTRFTLFKQGDQTLDQLEELAPEIALSYMRGEVE